MKLEELIVTLFASCLVNVVKSLFLSYVEVQISENKAGFWVLDYSNIFLAAFWILTNLEGMILIWPSLLTKICCSPVSVEYWNIINKLLHKKSIS